MRRVTPMEYRSYLEGHSEVRIGDAVLKLRGKQSVQETSPPKGFKLENWNVWSFPDRGFWATHSGDYRGNWSPYIPRNLILRYSGEGDVILDPMVGSGTTLVEARLLGRRAIGVDVNPLALILSMDRLNFDLPSPEADSGPREIRTYEGDARYLNEVSDESIDLVLIHPPYANIVQYSTADSVEGDLSVLADLDAYLEEMGQVARECSRVLKPGRYCSLMVGDTRRRKHHVPLAFRVMLMFLHAGFILREDIVKLQWNTRSERGKWKGFSGDFLLLAHEHIFVFRKPTTETELSAYRPSTRWW